MSNRDNPLNFVSIPGSKNFITLPLVSEHSEDLVSALELLFLCQVAAPVLHPVQLQYLPL